MKKLFLVLFIGLLTLLVACTPTPDAKPTSQTAQVEVQESNLPVNEDQSQKNEVTVEIEEPIVEPTDEEIEVESEEPVVAELSNAPEWHSTVLTDVRDGSTFKISDFSGKPVFIESFAVWCPTCTRQQKEFKSLHDKLGDSIVSIGLNTDPNENRDKVLNHIESNNFDWRYSISPQDFTQALIDEFGIGVVNAPSAPVILICGDGSSHFLDRGVKDVSELEEALSTNCGI